MSPPVLMPSTLECDWNSDSWVKVLDWSNTTQSAVNVRPCLFPSSCCLCERESVCVCDPPAQPFRAKSPSGSYEGRSSRCLSLIHGRWTASAAIPLPPFYIAYLSRKHSAHLPALTAPASIWQLSTDAAQSSVYTTSSTKTLIVLDPEVSLHVHLHLLLSLHSKRLPLSPQMPQTLYGRICV